MIKHIMNRFNLKSGENTPNEVGATKYTCPMHPEVQSTSPDSCPKCGMFLKPVDNNAAGKTMKESDNDDKPAQKHGCC